jgi:hypothetical protein
MPGQTAGFDGLGFHLGALASETGKFLRGEIAWKEREGEDRYRLYPPAFILQGDDVQGLMDFLWMQGYRPKYARSGDALVDALKDHVSDLKRIVFHALEVPKE